MIVTLYKGLSNKPRVIEVPASLAIKDALPNEDTGRAAIFVNNKAADENYILKEGDNVIIRLAPAGVTVALVAIAVVAVAAAIAVGVMAYKAKKAAEAAAEELEKLKEQTNSDIDNRPFLRGASNTAATSATQPFVCGRRLFTPYTLSDAFYELSGTDGEDQFANIILEGGFNKQIIDTVGVDDITILTLEGDEPQEGSFATNANTVFAGGTVEIAQDGELLTAIPALNYKVVSTTANEEVPRASDISSGDAEDYVFTLDAHAMDVTICISFASGLYAYNDDGDKISTSVEITPQYSLDGGSTWTSFTFYNSYTGEDTNTFSRSTSTRELRYAAYKAFSLSDYQALYNNGQEAIYCRVRSGGASDSQICNTCHVLYYQSACFDPNTSSSPAGVLDDGGAAGLVKCLVLNDKERALSTLIGVRLKATASNEDKLSKIFVITSGVARTWDGARWSGEKTATRNPAAWALEILASDTHPLSKYSDDEIDLESFGDFYEFCEENGFYFDYVISQKTKKETVLGYIMDSCSASLYTDIYGRKAIAIDREQENALAVYNPQNIISIENTREFARRTDCVRVTFVNSENDLFEEDTYTVMREVGGEPLELEADSVITDITMSGVTTYEHVVKYARRLMAIETLRPKTTTIEVGNEGVFYTPYSKILLQDDSLKIGTGSAVVAGVSWQDNVARTLYLKGSVTVEEGKSYGVIIQCFTDGGARPLSLRVSGDVGEVSELNILTVLDSAAEAVPEGGETLSFGELDEDGEFTKITTPYVITGISRRDGGFSLELANYDEAIYDAGTIPDYSPNITQRPPSSSAEIPADFISRDAMYDAITGVVGGLNDGSTGRVGEPDPPANVSAVAGEERIALYCAMGGVGLRNSLRLITYEITRADGRISEASFSGTEGYYAFDRGTDGYPEAEDLQGWRVRAKALNTYGKESDWSSSVAINTNYYGTWLVSPPDVHVAVSGRTITLAMSQPALASGRDRYGTFYNRLQIQKPSESGDWYKPAQSLDPYADEANWQEGEGYVVAQDIYTQTMPLTGQALREVEVEGETVQQSAPEATLYRFKIEAFSEAGEAEAKEINATALATSIQDIVQGSVTHDKISTPSLSAITANMGVISSGGFTGSENNYWFLSTIQGMAASTGFQNGYEGAFRVGGDEEYMMVMPQVVNSVITGYKIFFKAGVFEVTSDYSTINGEIIVQASEGSLNRTRITPSGTYYEYRTSPASDDWTDSAYMNIDGVRSGSVTNPSAPLVITNMDIEERRALGHDIGRAYLSGEARVWHFDTGFLDQNKEEGVEFSGGTQWVDFYLVNGDSYPDSTIDFTPALAAVAPYTEVAMAAYGTFRASVELKATNAFTCDFWIQYIWNEDQALFDVGNASDGARLVLSNGECYFNGYQEETDAAPFNAEILEAGDVIVWNEPAGPSEELIHYGQGGSVSESCSLDSLGVDLAKNEWLHVAVAFTEKEIACYLGGAEVYFARNATAAAPISVSINETAGTILLDELYLDTGAAESFADFKKGTELRIPWGALDYNKWWLVLDASALVTNIFDTDAFRDAVKEIINGG